MRYVTIIGGKCANLCVYKCDYACQEKRGSQSVPVQIKPFVTARTGPGVSMRNGRKKKGKSWRRVGTCESTTR